MKERPLYIQLKDTLEACKCEVCGGLGKCDDAEAGDIGYNEWECKPCLGSGLNLSLKDNLYLMIPKLGRLNQ